MTRMKMLKKTKVRMTIHSDISRVLLLLLLVGVAACVDDEKPSLKGVFDDEVQNTGDYDLADIQNSGELIVLTLYGPDTYFEFRGEEFGNQFRLAQAYAKSIGATVRIEVCRTQREMLRKLIDGEADLIAYDMPVDSLNDTISFCGAGQLTSFLDSLAVVEHDKSIKTSGNVGWIVRKTSPELAAGLNKWMAVNSSRFFEISQPKVHSSGSSSFRAYVSDEYFPDIPAFYDYPGDKYSSSARNSSSYSSYSSYSGSGTYVGSSGIQSRGKGISVYDALFMRYSTICGWDWKLLAAVAHNESGFNPNAVSSMGAMGLMQLMPSTARHYGVSNPYDPEQSVRGSAQMFAKLLQHYSSVPDPMERIKFSLAAYNAGPGHVDDARRLAEKRGKNKNIWRDNVDEFVLYISNPEYYNDPVVKYGYFRGGETYNYVNYIMSDWERYRNK